MSGSKATGRGRVRAQERKPTDWRPAGAVEIGDCCSVGNEADFCPHFAPAPSHNLVRSLGIEPRTHRLKVCCSTN